MRTWLAEGTAKGGPRDGVKLSASTGWDGRVLKRTGKQPYPGRYKWNGRNWVWEPEKEPKEKAEPQAPNSQGKIPW